MNIDSLLMVAIALVLLTGAVGLFALTANGGSRRYPLLACGLSRDETTFYIGISASIFDCHADGLPRHS